MRRVASAVILLLLICVSTGSAFELSGGYWSLSEQEFIEKEFVPHIYTADIAFIEFGPIKLMGSGLYGGKIHNINEFIDLLGDKLDEDKLRELDDFYLLGGLDGKVRVDWPIAMSNLDLIASLGYKVSGNVAKNDADITSGLYGGIIYGGGIGIGIAPGLSLAGTYEYAPLVKNIVGDDDEGTIRAFDVNLKYQIPLVFVKAGYRSEVLKLDLATGHRVSGFYVGAGIHF